MEKQALAVRKQQWYQTITTAKQSGQSIKSWCAENSPLSSCMPHKNGKNFSDRFSIDMALLVSLALNVLSGNRSE